MDIAIIGSEIELPGVDTMDGFYNALLQGKNFISKYPIKEKHSKNYIPYSGFIETYLDFNASYFNFSQYEAEFLHPQHRSILKIVNALLKNYNNRSDNNTIGIYTAIRNAVPRIDYTKLDSFSEKITAIMLNYEDFVATQVAYRLNLTGPAININTACSSSLVALIKACQSLLLNEADMMIVATSCLRFPFELGYEYQENGIYSREGACRPFDISRSGTVPGAGNGAVLLKSLENAEKDNDNILAVIKGFSINNDGKERAGYIAPGYTGQRDCIKKAWVDSGCDLSVVDFIETHGTGTNIGDDIEFSVLNEIFGVKYKECYLGTLKANIGHLDAASGLIGLIRIILSMQYKILFKSINFEYSELDINKKNSSFKISKAAVPLNKDFLAGISSFGIGGTNAHVVLKNYNASKNITILKTILKNEAGNIPYNLHLDNDKKNEVRNKVIDDLKNTEFFLTNIFSNLLLKPDDEINEKSSFFELGGDSVAALSLVTSIEKQFGVLISLDEIYNNRTIPKLAKYIENRVAVECKLRTISKNIELTKNIIFIHPSNGNLYPYNDLFEILKDNYNLYGIENPIFSDIRKENSEVDFLAQYYLDLIEREAINGQINLFSWSLGGIVTYALAELLVKNKFNLNKAIFIDAWAKYPHQYHDEDYVIKTYATRYGNKRDNGNWEKQSENIEKWDKLHWKGVQAAVNHKLSSQKLDILLFKASTVLAEYQNMDDKSNYWSTVSSGNIKTFIISTDHYMILKDKKNIEYIRETITEHI